MALPVAGLPVPTTRTSAPWRMLARLLPSSGRIRDLPDLPAEANRHLPALIEEIEAACRPCPVHELGGLVEQAFLSITGHAPGELELRGYYAVLAHYPEPVIRRATRRVLRDVYTRPTPSDWVRRAEEDPEWKELAQMRAAASEWHRRLSTSAARST